MRLFITALALSLCALGGTADARGHSHSSTYTNVDGHHVHSPVYTRHAPRGASAQCGDGSYSFSQHARGTCSHHGGVASWR